MKQTKCDECKNFKPTTKKYMYESFSDWFVRPDEDGTYHSITVLLVFLTIPGFNIVTWIAMLLVYYHEREKVNKR